MGDVEQIPGLRDFAEYSGILLLYTECFSMEESIHQGCTPVALARRCFDGTDCWMQFWVARLHSGSRCNE